MFPGLSQLTYQQRLVALHLPTLQYRRYRCDMIEMFKLSHGHYDEAAIHDFIVFGSNDTSEPRLRQHKYHVKKEKFRKDVRKFAFKCRVAEQWNRLPRPVAATLNNFKNKIDKLWNRDGIMYNPRH